MAAPTARRSRVILRALDYTVFVYFQFLSGHYYNEVVHVEVTVYRPVVFECKGVRIAVPDFYGKVRIFFFFAFVAFIIESATGLNGVFRFVETSVDAFVLFKWMVLVRTFYFSLDNKIPA